MTHAPSLKERTLDGIIHQFKHLASHLGERFSMRSLKLPDLQGNVEKRSKGNRDYPDVVEDLGVIQDGAKQP